MLRITHVDDSEAGPTIKLEGKLFGPWIKEIVRVVAASTVSGAHPRLDLSKSAILTPQASRCCGTLTGAVSPSRGARDISLACWTQKNRTWKPDGSQCPTRTDLTD